MKSITKSALTLAIFTSGLLLASAANAVLITDRGTFEAALGATVVDDYESAGYTFIQSDAAMSAVVGETQYSATGHPNTDIVFLGLGSHFYCAGCNGSFLLDFTNTSVGSANGVFGVGFDFFNSGFPVYNAFITYGDGSTENVGLDQVFFPGTEFLGITSDLLISTIHFGLAGGGVSTAGSFGIDNLTIGSRATPVDEPTTLGLLGVGLLGFGLARRKRAA